jgi:hypothetical protein
MTVRSWAMLMWLEHEWLRDPLVLKSELGPSLGGGEASKSHWSGWGEGYSVVRPCDFCLWGCEQLTAHSCLGCFHIEQVALEEKLLCSGGHHCHLQLVKIRLPWTLPHWKGGPGEYWGSICTFYRICSRFWFTSGMRATVLQISRDCLTLKFFYSKVHWIRG